nr:ATP-binding protein [uncultured Carboxylicivirga sp.]
MNNFWCLYDSIPSNICLIDKELKIKYVNSTFKNTFKSYLNNQVHSIGQIFPKLKDEEYLLKLSLLFDNGEATSLSVQYLDNGIIKHFKLQVNLLKDDKSSSHHAIIIIEDVSDLINQIIAQNKQLNQIKITLDETKKAKLALTESEESLIISNNTKNKLLSIISHDLKTPLNALVNISDLLIQNECDVHEECRNVDLLIAINLSAKQSLEMVTNLLSWARTQLKRINPHRIEFCLCDLFKDVTYYFAGSLKSKNLDINIDLPNEDCVVYADFDMIKLVLQNLISNAIKYSYSGGKIDLIVKDTNDSFTIIISDNGVGMDEEIIDILSETEYINSIIGTNNEMGTGLGLSVCNEFLKFHDSSLQVESTKNVVTSLSFKLLKADN